VRVTLMMRIGGVSDSPLAGAVWFLRTAGAR
jgi:hypothetical protein